MRVLPESNLHALAVAVPLAVRCLVVEVMVCSPLEVEMSEQSWWLAVLLASCPSYLLAAWVPWVVAPVCYCCRRYRAAWSRHPIDRFARQSWLHPSRGGQEESMVCVEQEVVGVRSGDGAGTDADS